MAENEINSAITIECGQEKTFSREDEPYRNLLFAIIYQAYYDALRKPKQPRIFLSKENKIFTLYCRLLNYDPSWLAAKLNQAIEKKLNKKSE